VRRLAGGLVVGAMVDKRDRQTLSRDIEVIADRIARSGQAGRADELKVVAAHLRAKEAARTGDPAGRGPDPAAPRAYILGIGLLMSWLAVVLLVVLLLA
jgi:hypothetical protein